MTIEQNKELVRKTWNALLGGDAEGGLANLTDDVTWTIAGALPNISGVKRGKKEVRSFLENIARSFPDGLRSELKKVYAEGSTVIVELTNRGTAANGKPYENDYCFVFDVEGGGIRAIREYVDLYKVAKTFDM